MAEDRLIADEKFLRLKERRGWQFVERPHITGIIAVIPVTNDGKLVLVEQYRIPVEANVIELPAGLVGDDGDPDEDLVTAAKRELHEETGYEADYWERAYEGPPSPGLSNEIVTFFYAENLRKTGLGGGVGNEGITVHEIPLADVPDWIALRVEQGAMVDPKLFGGLWYSQRIANFPPSGP